MMLFQMCSMSFRSQSKKEKSRKTKNNKIKNVNHQFWDFNSRFQYTIVLLENEGREREREKQVVKIVVELNVGSHRNV